MARFDTFLQLNRGEPGVDFLSAAVAYVRGKRPENGTIELAEQKGIPVLVCDLAMFEACGRMYESGLAPGSTIEETH